MSCEPEPQARLSGRRLQLHSDLLLTESLTVTGKSAVTLAGRCAVREYKDASEQKNSSNHRGE